MNVCYVYELFCDDVCCVFCVCVCVFCLNVRVCVVCDSLCDVAWSVVCVVLCLRASCCCLRL